MKYTYKGQLFYPAFTYIPFTHVEGVNAVVCYLEWDLNGKHYKIPGVMTGKEYLSAGPKLLQSLYENLYNSAHDMVDEILKRGDFAPRLLKGVEKFLTDKYNEYFKDKVGHSIVFYVSQLLFDSYEAGLISIMRFTTAEDLNDGVRSLAFKAAKVLVDPNLKQWDIRIEAR